MFREEREHKNVERNEIEHSKIRATDGNGAGDICGTTVRNKRVFFWMRWLQRS